VGFIATKDGGWKTPFDPERLRGVKLLSDLVNAKDGQVMAEEGTKMTPRLASRLVEDGLKDQLVQDADLLGRYIAADIINEETGAIYVEAGDELTEESIEALREAGVKSISTLAIDHVNVGPYIRNTLAIDKNRSREEALTDIYRVMRPGEPPTADTAEAMFRNLFFDS
ncbi:MAG: DNA-directed RNA polymerase subunit beta, partial [Alphaproteobacteria bacterium]|nr:DNA-directed RNA polymerase subunit beta [Alphaproteobacteria bacterium]